MASFAARGCSCAVALLLLLPAFAQDVPFPTDATQLPRHCLSVSGAGVVGRDHPSNPRAVALMAPAEKLYEELLPAGVFSRQELADLEKNRDQVVADVLAFLERSGVKGGRNPTNEVLDGIASHITQCRAWVASRPPVLEPLPRQRDAMVGHCVAVSATAASLTQLQGNRSSQQGALAARIARNARDMQAEMYQARVSDPQADRKRLQPPEGDLYLKAVDLAFGLKMQAGPLGAPKIDEVDMRSLRLLDGRVRECHKALGLQMPLQ